MPSRSKIRRIWRTVFYIYGCTIVRNVALRWAIFKQKKGSATICLGLIYCSMGSSQPKTHGTVLLTRDNWKKWAKDIIIICYTLSTVKSSTVHKVLIYWAKRIVENRNLFMKVRIYRMLTDIRQYETISWHCSFKVPFNSATHSYFV
jgi:hypothetical protein